MRYNNKYNKDNNNKDPIMALNIIIKIKTKDFVFRERPKKSPNQKLGKLNPNK